MAVCHKCRLDYFALVKQERLNTPISVMILGIPFCHCLIVNLFLFKEMDRDSGIDRKKVKVGKKEAEE